MRMGASYGLAMALTLGLIFAMSQEGECNGLDLGLGKLGLGPHGRGQGRGHGRGPHMSSSPPYDQPQTPPNMEPSTPPPLEPSTPPPPPTPESPPPQSFTPPPISTPTPESPPPPSSLQEGFYKGKCSIDIEAFIANRVRQLFPNDRSILAALLRMQFHDCFVHGCDASILIDEPKTSEKYAGANGSVRGYEFIDALKFDVEQQCRDVVSCADIVAIATKVVVQLGGGPDIPLRTGRKDGLVSKIRDVDLPSPSLSVSDTFAMFRAKGFTLEEMVALLGCHTVGIAHCGFFQNRLYEGNPGFDPLMDKSLRDQLTPICPKNTQTNNTAALDQNSNSANIVDNSFYDQILKQRGILQIDQALARTDSTKEFVQKLAVDRAFFNAQLSKAMVKLQELKGEGQGNIRKVCSRFN